MAKWKGNPTVTLVGNVVREPELRFTASGLAVANFTMVTKDRDDSGGEWRDVDETFWKVSCWRQVAENVAESGLVPGQEVIVSGPMRMTEYETKEGEKRKSLEVTGNTVGVSLARVHVDIRKAERSSTPAGGATDPWTEPDKPTVPDEPPF